MRTVLIFAVVTMAALWGVAAPNPFEAPAGTTLQTAVDELVLRNINKPLPPPCSDAVFIRRVYLDLIGTLPTEAETRAFLLDRKQNKRGVLIDRLLEREEFADYWAMKWSDLLRVKAEFPINLWPNAAQAYHRWIRTAVRDNMPYDQFVRELLTASGSNFRVPQVNFYRAVQSREPATLAQAVALTFMGERAEKWPQERLADMAAFFSRIGYKSTLEWKEEIVYFAAGNSNAPTTGLYPDGTQTRLWGARDPRELFAEWLITPDNPWFTRNIANRMWSWLLGRGIIHEPDDIRPDNPPMNAELLAFLQRELIAARFDLKHLFRLIANSQTYQGSTTSAQDEASEPAYRRYQLRRLDAEVLIDCLCQITGTSEKYSSAIPEPFTFIPEGQRSIALPDGSITSSFLEQFGRPARDTGLENERNNRITASQRLHLLNSSHIQRKLEQSSKFQSLLQSRRAPKEVATSLYLTILSRFPTAQELNQIAEYGQKGLRGREVANDVAWALINSPEFLYRH